MVLVLNFRKEFLLQTTERQGNRSSERAMVLRPHKIFVGNLCVFKCVAKKVFEIISD